MQQGLEAWVGHDVVDVDGDRIGEISDLYVDDETGQPDWLAVTTGMFGTKQTFVPAAGATADGDVLRVPYQKQLVKDAPRVDADGHLGTEEEDVLYRHYGLSYGAAATGGGNTVETDTRTRSNDDAMTRSEEELRVDKVRREAGRARLRKYVVTEDVQVTVPVQREVARLETEPITDANRGAALDGPDITSSEHEVVLTEEEVVVDKVTVPKERVRLETETVTEERQVSEEVRKERIEADGDVRTSGPRR